MYINRASSFFERCQTIDIHSKKTKQNKKQNKDQTQQTCRINIQGR